MLFVNACRLILRPSIDQADIDKAHSFFLKFLVGCEKLYSKITVNQHLQVHLKEAMEDFSTPYAFWLFSFERCNGYLGSFNHNNRNIELTFMKRFWEASRLKSNASKMFKRITDSISPSSTASVSLLDGFKLYLEEHIFSRDNHYARIRKQEEEGYNPINMLDYPINFDTNVTGSEVLPFGTIPDETKTRMFKKVDMAPEHYMCLSSFYCDTYNFDNTTHISRIIKKFMSIHYHGKVYNSAESRSLKGTNVQCLFLSNNRATPEAWPGKIMYFFQHDLRLPGSIMATKHTFAFVQFFSPYNASNNRKYEKQGLEVWSSKYSAISRDCIVPISRIYSQVAVAKKEIRRRNENRNSESFPLVIIPLQRNVHA